MRLLRHRNLRVALMFSPMKIRPLWSSKLMKGSLG
jgi:hypothetical protein